MIARRQFLQLTAAAAAATQMGWAEGTRSGARFGVQLYMVRSLLADLPETLALIHSIGYQSVETYPLVYNRPAAELKKQINDAGLVATSGHFDYDTLSERVDYAAELGLKYMICPWIPKPLQDSLDGFRQAAAHFNQVGERARKAGLRFGFHPHNYEFKPYEGGKKGFDVLMRELDPAIRLELDIYWAVEAGQDPIEMLKSHRDRIELLHIKDRKAVAGVTYAPDEHAAHFTEVGKGSLDWKSILRVARSIGVHEFYVDQDGFDIPVAESLRDNWKGLAALEF